MSVNDTFEVTWEYGWKSGFQRTQLASGLNFPPSVARRADEAWRRSGFGAARPLRRTLGAMEKGTSLRTAQAWRKMNAGKDYTFILYEADWDVIVRSLFKPR